jgi:hypothetical protein
MNCDEFRARRLSGEDGGDLDAHLAECPSCRGIRSELDRSRSALGDSSVWAEPPPELADRVVGLVTGTRIEGGGAPRRGRRVLAAVAAAAVVLIVAAGVFGVLGRGAPPDWEIALPATELAPGASSSVAGWNTDSGTRMVLTVDGLDPAPAGYVYELWLSKGSVHVSAGTFARDGEIEVWTGVTRADFPRLWVTLEPLDGDAGPSWQTVLDTDA